MRIQAHNFHQISLSRVQTYKYSLFEGALTLSMTSDVVFWKGVYILNFKPLLTKYMFAFTGVLILSLQRTSFAQEGIASSPMLRSSIALISLGCHQACESRSFSQILKQETRMTPIFAAPTFFEPEPRSSSSVLKLYSLLWWEFALNLMSNSVIV